MSKDPPNRRAGGSSNVLKPSIAAGRVQPGLDAIASRLASLNHLDAELATYVQAAHELRAIEPLITDHDHGLEVGLYRIEAMSQLRMTPVTAVAEVNYSLGERTLEPQPVPLAVAPSPGPITQGGLGDRLDALERWAGSLATLSGQLQAVVGLFDAHRHPFRWSWQPYEGMTPPFYTAVSAPSLTEGTGLTLPAIDRTAALPNPGFPRSSDPVEVRISRLADDLGKLRDTYPRFASVARSFASHQHRLHLGISPCNAGTTARYVIATSIDQLKRTGPAR